MEYVENVEAERKWLISGRRCNIANDNRITSILVMERISILAIVKKFSSQQLTGKMDSVNDIACLTLAG